MTLAQAVLETAVGPVRVSATAQGLREVHFEAPGARATPIPEPLKESVGQLQAYFSGARREFSLALDPEGTDFQKRVWAELVKIPFGQTISYSELAQCVGGPTFTRAVGLANGANPIAVIVPCHRVIGADGSLVGYAGGLDRKQWLLAHEQRALGRPVQARLDAQF